MINQRYIDWMNEQKAEAQQKIRDLLIFDILFLTLIACGCSFFSAFNTFILISCGTIYFTIMCGYLANYRELEWNEAEYIASCYKDGCSSLK